MMQRTMQEDAAVLDTSKTLAQDLARMQGIVGKQDDIKVTEKEGGISLKKIAPKERTF